MLVRREGYYEAGAFDARCSPPRPTAIAHAIMKLTAGSVVEHPVLDRPGWWCDTDVPEKARPILLAGFGHLISTIEECCHLRRLRVVAAAAHTDLHDLAGQLDAWAVVETYQAKATSALHNGNPLYLYCRYPDAGTLSIEAAQSQDWHGIVNAFLDMIVDQAQGEMRLTGAAPDNQYMSLLRYRIKRISNVRDRGRGRLIGQNTLPLQPLPERGRDGLLHQRDALVDALGILVPGITETTTG